VYWKLDLELKLNGRLFKMNREITTLLFMLINKNLLEARQGVPAVK
jgi:hypothetical protein